MKTTIKHPKQQGHKSELTTHPSQLKQRAIEFSIFNPSASRVSVSGSFNDWSARGIHLKKEKDGTWHGSVRLKPGRYEYRLLVNGEWTDDPSAGELVENAFGTMNAVIEVR